jgi:hypothetical protein
MEISWLCRVCLKFIKKATLTPHNKPTLFTSLLLILALFQPLTGAFPIKSFAGRENIYGKGRWISALLWLEPGWLVGVFFVKSPQFVSHFCFIDIDSNL